MGYESFGGLIMTFAEAINYLNLGYCVRRFDDVEHFITKQVPQTIESDIIPRMTSLSKFAKELLLKYPKRISYKNQMLIVNMKSGEAEQYSTTVGDILATDWTKVE